MLHRLLSLHVYGRLAARFALLLLAVAVLLALAPASPSTAAASDRAASTAGSSTGSGTTSTADSTQQALATAAAQGSPVEVSSLATEYTSTFANPDGTLSLRQYTVPVHAPSGSGTWVPIDTMLHANSDGSWSPTAVVNQFSLNGGGGTDLVWQPLITTAASGQAPNTSWLWRGILPAPVISGATATYVDVAAGVNLVVTATPTGFEQSFVLTSRPTTPTLVLPLALDNGSGLTLREGASGVFSLVDSSGATVASSGAPIETSASGATDIATGDVVPDGQAASTAVQAALPSNGTAVTSDAGNQAPLPVTAPALTSELDSIPAGDQGLVIVPNASALQNPKTTFPFTVDPTVTLGATFDTYVRSDQPTTAFPSATDLEVGNTTSTVHYRSYLTFDFTALKAQIPDSSEVISSTFYAYEYAASTSSTCTATSWQLRQSTTPTSLTTWASQPTYDAAPFATSPNTVAGGANCAAAWRPVDITSWTKSKVIGGTASKPAIVLMASDETAASNQHSFYSMDYPGTYDPIHQVYKHDFTPYIQVNFTAATPGAPTAALVYVPQGTHNQVTVSWTAPASSGSGPITGYTVTSIPDGRTCTAFPMLFCTVIGLSAGPYQFTVTASNAYGTGPASLPAQVEVYDANGNLGPPVDPNTHQPIPPQTEVSTAEPPSVPGSVSATAGSNAATVAWSASVSNGAPVSGYVVNSVPSTSDPDVHSCSTTGGLSCVVPCLKSSVAYQFRVSATNAAGTSDTSAATTAVTPSPNGAPPAGPTNIRVRSGQNGSVVTWSPPASTGAGVCSYVVTATDSANPAHTVSMTVSNALTSVDMFSLPTGTYCFTVAAQGLNGASASTSGPCALANTAPAALPAATQPTPSIALTPVIHQTTAGAFADPNTPFYYVAADVYDSGQPIYVASGPDYPYGAGQDMLGGFSLEVTHTDGDHATVGTGPTDGLAIVQYPGSGTNGNKKWEFTNRFQPGWNHVQFKLYPQGPYNPFYFKNPWYLVGAPGYTAARMADFASLMDPTAQRCHAGDPVDCATGNFYQTYQDFSLPGRGAALSLSRTYNSLLAGEDSPFGYGWSSSYDWFLTTDSSGSVAVHEPSGSITLFQAAKTTMPGVAPAFVASGRTTATLDQNADGTYRLTIDHKTIYTFNTAGQLISETDLDGLNAKTSTGSPSPYLTSLAYDATGRLSTVTDPSGRTLTFGYTDTTFHVSSVTDSTGRTATYKIDANGDLRSVTDVGAAVTKFDYLSGHLLGTITLPDNGQPTVGGVLRARQIINTYDSSNRVKTQTDPDQNVTSYDYSPTINDTACQGSQTCTIVTSPGGYKIERIFARGELVKMIRGYGTASAVTTTYAYGDALSEQPTETATYDSTNPGTPNIKTVCTYLQDDTGRLATRENFDSANVSLGDKVTYTYTPQTYQVVSSTAIGTLDLGEVSTVTFATPTTVAGQETISNTYDTYGHLIRRTLSNTVDSWTQTTTSQYLDQTHPGDLTSVTDPNGNSYTNASGVSVAPNPALHTHTFKYDTNGNVISDTDGYGNQTTWLYDSRSFLKWSVTPRGNVAGGTPSLYQTQFTKNAWGETTLTQSPLGQTSKATYWPDGSLHTTTDPENNTTSYWYWRSGLTSQINRPSGATTSYTYDVDGNLKTVKDGTGRTTTYAFDTTLNHLTSVSTPGAGVTLYNYDALGRLKTQTRRQTTNGSDLTTSTLTYTALGQVSQTDFTPTGTPSTTTTYWPNGQIKQSASGAAATRFTYDGLGHTVSEVNGNGQTTSWTYDGDGNVLSTKYPDGKTATQAFDGNGRQISVTDWNGKTTFFGYDPDSNLTSITYPNGDTASTTFNQTQSPSQVQFKNGASLLASFVYANGNSTQTDQLRSLTPTSTVAGFNPPNETYGYDSLNRLSAVNGAAYQYDQAGQPQTLGATTLAIDPTSGQVTASTVGTTQNTYQYNAQGDRTLTAGALNTTNTFDAADHLTAFAGAKSATYTYDASGLRSTKTVNGTTLQYAWQPGPIPLLLTDGSTDFLYGPGGLPVEQVQGSVRNYLLHDQTGSTRVLVDDTGSAVGTYTYSVFGSTLTHTGVSTSLQWQGQYADDESSYIYLRSRYYDPATAQFLTQDPLQSITGTPYAYAGDDPVNASDPTGLSPGSTFDSLVMTFDPMYLVVDGTGNLVRDIKAHCSLGTIWADTTEIGKGVVLTGSLFLGGGAGLTRDVGEGLATDASDVFRMGGNASVGESDYAAQAMLRFSEKNPEEGLFDVIGHGSPNDIAGRSAAQIADKIRAASGGQDIRLLSCQTGSPSGTFAQDLADNLGVRVKAPTTDIGASTRGNTLTFFDGGEWRWFSPGG